MIDDLPFAATMFWSREPERPELDGRRRILHRSLPLAIAGAAALAFVGYLLPAHQLDGQGAFHSNFADGGVLPLILLAAIAAFALALRGRRFGTGITAGVATMLGAALAMLPVLVPHLVHDVHSGIGQHVFVAGILATFAGGAALAIGEPLLYASTRRAAAQRSLR